MRRGLWIGLLLATGCEHAGLRAVVGEVELQSDALHFERTFVGFPTQRTLVLDNRSRLDRRLTVTTAAPFSSATAVLVPGGARVELQVTFAPAQAGLASGKVTISDGQQRFEVPLDGAGALPLACAPSGLCRLSVFDPGSGSCVESVASDGAACSSTLACAVEGFCSSGLCLGSSPSCADGDPCTIDSCQVGGGCMHQPKRCAAPSNPCKVASCDPLRGCVESDAADGTSCGASDCQSGNVCIGGECRTLPVPEGAACGESTPCRGRGVCRARSCELPAPAPLKEAWNHPFPGDFDFRGVTDADQNLYWLECNPRWAVACAGCLRCAAVSVTRDGVERFRTDVGPLPLNGAWMMLHLLAKDRLVYSANGRLGSISVLTGVEQWSASLTAVLQTAPDLANTELVQSIAADGAGKVYLLVRRYQNTPSSAFPRQNALVKLDAVSGLVELTGYFDGELTSAVVDEHDQLFFGFYPRAAGGQPPPELRSLDSAGIERWRVSSSSIVPLAVFGGQLVLSGGAVVSTADGASLFSAPPEGQQRNALMSSSARTLLKASAMTKPLPLPAAAVNAIALPSQSAAPAWDQRVAEATNAWYGLVSDLVSSSTGDVLVAGVQTLGSTHLTALTSTGATRFVCEVAPPPLPEFGVRYNSAVALLEGRWGAVERVECFVCDQGGEQSRLRMFEVPGERPARRGWVGALGSPAGASRPLP